MRHNARTFFTQFRGFLLPALDPSLWNNIEVFFHTFGYWLTLLAAFSAAASVVLAVRVASRLLSFTLFKGLKSPLESFLTSFVNRIIDFSLSLFLIVLFFQIFRSSIFSDYFAFLIDLILVDCGGSDSNDGLKNQCATSCPPAPIHERGYPRCVNYKKCGEYARKLWVCWTLCGPRMEDHIMEKPFWQFWPKKYVDVRQVRETQLSQAEKAIAFQNYEENGLKRAMIDGLTDNWVKRWGFGVVGCFCLLLFFVIVIVGHVLAALFARFFLGWFITKLFWGGGAGS